MGQSRVNWRGRLRVTLSCLCSILAYLAGAIAASIPGILHPKAADKYVAQRTKFFAQLSGDDRKYLSFQLWKEGIARYTQVKAAEEAAKDHKAMSAYAALPDFETFGTYVSRARAETLSELQHADLATSQRVIVYSWGSSRGLPSRPRQPEMEGQLFQKSVYAGSVFRRG